MKPKKKNTVEYIVFGILVYLMLIFVTMHATAIMQENPDIEPLAAINAVSSHIMHNPFDVAINLDALSGVTMAAFCVAAYFYIDEQRNHHDAAGIEAGSAKWNEDIKGYNKKYSDPIGKPNFAPDGKSNNMILSQNIRLSMDGRKTRLNNNILVVGGSGSGKSRFFVKPNLLQMNASYVVTDPKGELLETIGGALAKEGYEIKVFDTVEMQYSDHYNPFCYLEDDTDVKKMVKTVISNTNPRGSGSGDPFWEKSETALLTALCLYLHHRCPKKDQNWGNVIRMLEYAEVDEANPKALSTLDIMFKTLEVDTERDARENGVEYVPDLAVRQYKIYQMAAGKTAKSILISAGVRLADFQMPKIANLTSTDDIDLTHIGDRKVALFCVVSASDTSFNYLVALMYTQLFDSLMRHAAKEYNGFLPTPVRFLLDEFANIGEIPNFDKVFAVIRSYNISASVILQSLSQLKSMYKDTYGGIMDNADTTIFLGGRGAETAKWISESLGKTTITGMSHGRSIGGKGGSNKNFSQQGRDLMTQDEIGILDNSCEIVLIRSLRAFMDKKYDYPKHPNYHLTGDADKKQIYPFRQIYMEREKQQKMVAAQQAEVSKKREKNRCRSNKEITKFRDDKKKEQQPIAVSLAGHKCLTPQDAEEVEKKNQNMQEEFFEAYAPATDNFDSDFEFRDGIEGYSLEDAIADCKELILRDEEELVVEVDSLEPPENAEEDDAEGDPFAQDVALDSDGELNGSSFMPPEDAEDF